MRSIHLLARSIAAGLGDSAFADPEYRIKVRTLWPHRADQIRLALFSARGFTPPVQTWARANGTWLVSAKEMV
jgi:hypothetical protein